MSHKATNWFSEVPADLMTSGEFRVLFLPSYGLIAGLTAGLTFTGMQHSSRYVALSVSPERCADVVMTTRHFIRRANNIATTVAHSSTVSGWFSYMISRMSRSSDKNSISFYPQIWRDGYARRRFELRRAPRPRFALGRDCWDSRQRSSGGFPAQKWGHVGRQCGSCVENGDNRQKVFRIHPVGTPYRGGMETRGGVVAPSRTRRFTMEQGWWDSGQRSPGGSS
jgi:hypothetical protein